ncbi:MAG: hypothetical protein HC895_16875 [Leptolyngbyaceae cyanobacterium SM1_3_5]|nr:hypothetical protein [Leptolyngbyaceae cyanobacterium SM1_3_5]
MNVVPLRTIVFQAMFVLIAIAIQSYIFRRQLQVSPRTSIEYAASIELLSVVAGWVLFFIVESLLPQVLRLQLFNFIFLISGRKGWESWGSANGDRDLFPQLFPQAGRTDFAEAGARRTARRSV